MAESTSTEVPSTGNEGVEVPSGASEMVLNIDPASFAALQGMGAFDGVVYSASEEDGVVSVRLTQAEFEKFQAKQGANVSIGKSLCSLCCVRVILVHARGKSPSHVQMRVTKNTRAVK